MRISDYGVIDHLKILDGSGFYALRVGRRVPMIYEMADSELVDFVLGSNGMAVMGWSWDGELQMRYEPVIGLGSRLSLSLQVGTNLVL